MKKVICLHYKLKDQSGDLIESTYESNSVCILTGEGAILPELEKELLLLDKGARARIFLEAVRAYGLRDESLLNRIPRNKLPTTRVYVGDVIEVESEEEGVQLATVVEISPSHIVLDGNHPLAGKDLTYEVEILENREAAPDEVKQGQPRPYGR